MYRNVSTDRNWSAVDFARAVAKEFVSFRDFFLSLSLSFSYSLYRPILSVDHSQYENMDKRMSGSSSSSSKEM